jgi:hypothetical protein
MPSTGTGPTPNLRRFWTNRALWLLSANVVILLLTALVLGAVFTRPVDRMAWRVPRPPWAD